jgi:ferric-dicitrate binding protein FerR (iron transport regulator)
MAWTENKLVFNNTPISEVANIIKKHYGIDVKLAEDYLAQKTITGIMPNDNLDVLLQSLNATQEFKVLKDGDSILITEFK